MRDRGNNHAVELLGGSIHSHHPRNGKTVNVGIDEAHALAGGGQRNREVRGYRGFPYSAFPGGHRDNAGGRIGARERNFPRGAPATQLLLQVLHLERGHGTHRDSNGSHAC